MDVCSNQEKSINVTIQNDYFRIAISIAHITKIACPTTKSSYDRLRMNEVAIQMRRVSAMVAVNPMYTHGIVSAMLLVNLWLFEPNIKIYQTI